MIKSPKISVCMPFYNVESYIKDAVESMLSQVFTDFELLLIDDGSTDNSVDAIRDIVDDRIVYIKCEHNYIESLNIGLKLARGKYIARMDGDDKSHKNRLLVQYNYLENNQDVVACGAGLERFGDSNERYIPSCLNSEEIEYGFMDYNCFTVGMVRRDFLLKHNIKYRCDFVFAEDYRFWSDIIISGGKIENLPQILYYYRMHNCQISKLNNAQMKINSDKIKKDIILYVINKYDRYINIREVNGLLFDLCDSGIVKLSDCCKISKYFLLTQS